MHHPKLKYNQQKLIWILMHEMCMFISISCLQLSHFAEISGPYIPLQHRMGRPRGVVYYCGQTVILITVVLITIHTQSLRNYTGELWIWILSSSPSLSTCTVYTQILSVTKSLHSWEDSPSSPSLQKKYGGHFVWCWLNEWWVQPHLYDCPYTRKKPSLCCWKAAPPGSLTFIF